MATIDPDMRLLLEWVFENALDEDKSGFIEEREANRVAKYCGYGGPDGDITALWTTMLREMDTDGDQRISKEEYVVFMSKSLEGSVAAARNLKDEVDAKLNQKAALTQAYEPPSLRTRGGGASASKCLEPLSTAEAATTEPKAPDPWALTIEDYRDPESIYAQLVPRGGLEHPPVKLLKWGWMERRADKLRAATTDEERRALALPRRQDLERDEPDAFYSAEEVRQLKTNDQRDFGFTQLSIVSVSHAWETSVHPDPRGANLLLLVDAIKRAQTTPEEVAGGGKARLLPSSLAVFFDFCSLFQRDPTLFEASETPEAKEEGEERDAFIAALKAKTAFYGGEAYDKSRSEAEGRPFKAALDNMEVWYAHAGTTVVMLTETPQGSSAVPYDRRGWPTFESSVAMLIKPYLGWNTWPPLIDVSLRASVCKRFAPLTPDGMHKLLMEKKFTNGADREVVVKLYTNVAERCIYPAKQLDYFGMSFGDEEMKVLCEWFPRCEVVERLELMRNAFTATGWDLLAEVVGREGAMPKLEAIVARENKDKPSDKLREVCEKRGVELNDGADSDDDDEF